MTDIARTDVRIPEPKPKLDEPVTPAMRDLVEKLSQVTTKTEKSKRSRRT